MGVLFSGYTMGKCCTWLGILIVVLNAECDAMKNFTGHKLIGMVPRTSEQVKFLFNLMDDPEADFWLEPSREMQNVSVHLPPERAVELEQTLRTMDLPFYTITDNLQKWIELESQAINRMMFLSEKKPAFAFDEYHRLQEIVSYLFAVCRKYSNLTELINLGVTYEGNVIYVLKISSGGPNTRPAVWIDAGIHAREWVAPASALFMINKLLISYGKNRKLTNLIDTYDWYILPLANPDGYSYTWETDRWWRKNKVVTQSYPGFCRGIDVNRNFDADFEGRYSKTSSQPCSSIFKGNRPFSEAESSAIRDGITEIKNRLKAYFTLHSYSQLWMSPYGYTTNSPPHFKDHMEVLKIATSAVKAKHGKSYKYGPIAQILYLTSGSSVDWVYATAGVKYSFVIELRDEGKFGFMLPNTQIIPTAQETWAGIEAVISHLHSEEFNRRNS